MLTDRGNSPYAKVHPLEGMAVEWTEGFWKDVVDTCRRATVPHLQRMFESKEISHVLENFRICAGEAQGDFDGTVFGDGDFYKWMEAAVFAAVQEKDPELLEKLDEYIDLIGRAQREDGYLSTKQIIGELNHTGAGRLGDINDFEVYNFGHLFTSACIHKRLTGKDSFLRIAEKAAGYLEKLYEEARRSGEVQTTVCPSHYMGLVELFRATGEKRYLDLAELAIAMRDMVKNGMDDNQDRIPLKEQRKIIGHAVRASYLYAGVADLYAERGDEEHLQVLHSVWRNLADTKVYITGGCGALYNGTSPYGNFFVDQKVHQAFGYEYQLPNVTAYNETCASLGMVFWASRMFRIEPRAEYFDMIERAMLNVNLAAVSLDGKKFFYENMLRRTKKLEYELVWPLTRSEYILSYCCPPNLARTIMESGEYAYLLSENTVWTGMYGANHARIALENGSRFLLVQDTEYPYQGEICFSFREVEKDSGMILKLRVQGWVQSGKLIIRETGRETERILTEEDASGYAEIRLEKLEGSSVILRLDMPVRYTVANPMVEEDCGQAAVERGPLVYCVESADMELDTLDDLLLDPRGEWKSFPMELKGRKLLALEGDAFLLQKRQRTPGALYQTLEYRGLAPVKLRMIPYFAWDNREFGEMRIWMPVAYR